MTVSAGGFGRVEGRLGRGGSHKHSQSSSGGLAAGYGVGWRGGMVRGSSRASLQTRLVGGRCQRGMGSPLWPLSHMSYIC